MGIRQAHQKCTKGIGGRVSKISVLMSGPLPPAIGGMASVLDGLGRSSLANRTELRMFDTGKKTEVNRSLLTGVQARFQLMWEWWRAVRRVDLVHIHTCSGFTYYLDGLLLLIAKLSRRPVILHVHGARFDQFLDELAWPGRKVAKCLARLADVVVVLSDDWRIKLESRLPGARLQVVPNGVAGNQARTLETRSSATIDFIFLGNLGKRKGVDVLLDAVHLSQGHWTVSLAGGDEEDGFTNWVSQHINELGIEARIRILGPVVGPEKMDRISEADGFVLPSRAEGLPMALLEAMAAGLPVVVTAVGAMPEVVEDGVHGFLVPPNDAKALADALDRLAADPALRSQMGSSARDRCEARFGVERTAEKLLQVYKQVLRVESLSSAAS